MTSSTELAAKPTLTFRTLLWLFVVGLAISTAVGLACSFIGSVRLPFASSWRIWDWELWRSQIWQVRVFRLLAAAVVGIALASAGMALQGLMRNPLAEPYILGISSGASLSVVDDWTRSCCCFQESSSTCSMVRSS